jgi:hypothetical protein
VPERPNRLISGAELRSLARRAVAAGIDLDALAPSVTIEDLIVLVLGREQAQEREGRIHIVETPDKS